MRRSRRTALGLLAAALVAGGVVALLRSGEPRPRSEPVRGSIVEWNLSGYAQNRGGTAAAERLVQEVTRIAPLPLAVVTTETCSSQFDLLRQRLGAPAYTYSAAADWSIPRFGRPGCASFGNAVFWRGTATAGGVERFTYPPTDQAQGAATQEQRNLVCVVLAVTPSPALLRICGTHLHRDPAVSARQLAVAHGRMDRDNASGPPTLLVGDLNTVPTAAVLDAWYAPGGYVEADLSPRAAARPTTTAKVKLDYCFLPSRSGSVTATADLLPVPTLSDHDIYVAHVLVQAPRG